MTCKTILVHVGVDPQTPVRLRAALNLGAHFGATVLGVGAIAWDPYVDPALGYADGETIQILRNEVDQDIAASEATFRAACAGQAHPVLWRSVMDYPGKCMTELSRCADLIVASAEQKGFDDRRCPLLTDLVMQSGLPVMLIPAADEGVSPRNVVIGWKNTRESRRAVSDALPLLKLAERVLVVQIAEGDAIDGAREGLEDVVGRLSRHGIQADWSIQPRSKMTVTEQLTDIVESRAADLLVLGAYGHARLREWAFGGVTADLLTASSKRILFSR